MLRLADVKDAGLVLGLSVKLPKFALLPDRWLGVMGFAPPPLPLAGKEWKEPLFQSFI